MNYRTRIRQALKSKLPGFYQGWGLCFHNRQNTDRRYWQTRRIFSVLIVDPISELERKRFERENDAE